MRKRRDWFGATAAKQLDIKQRFRVDVYCINAPRPFAIGLDSSLIDRDPASAALTAEMK